MSDAAGCEAENAMLLDTGFEGRLSAPRNRGAITLLGGDEADLDARLPAGASTMELEGKESSQMAREECLLVFDARGLAGRYLRASWAGRRTRTT